MQIYNRHVDAKRIHAELGYAKLILAKVSFDSALFQTMSYAIFPTFSIQKSLPME